MLVVGKYYGASSNGAPSFQKILASERPYRQIITLTNGHAIVTQNVVGGADMEIHIG